MYTIWPDRFPHLQNNLHIVNSTPSGRCLKISANSINLKLNAKFLHCIPDHPKGKKAPVHLSCLTGVSISLHCICLISCINQKSRNSSWGSPHIWNLYHHILKIILLTIYFHMPPVLIVSPDTMQRHLPSSLHCVDSPSPLCFPVLLEKGHLPIYLSNLDGCFSFILLKLAMLLLPCGHCTWCCFSLKCSLPITFVIHIHDSGFN